MKQAFRDFFRKLRNKATSQRSLDLALIAAAASGKTDKLQKLIESGANPKYKAYANETALTAAVEAGHAGTVSILMRAGAEADVQSHYDAQTPLITAVLRRDFDTLKALAAGGAGIDYRQRHRGLTPLMVAARENDIEMVKCLLDLGADINARDYGGDTALGHAVWRGSKAMASLLLDEGARADTVNNEMQTPQDLARERKRPEIFFLLQDHLDAKVEPWQPQGEKEIAHVSVKRKLGYRLTEIFNFEKQQVTTIAHNLETRRDVILVRAFSEIVNKEIIQEAQAKLALPAAQQAAPAQK